MAGAIKVGTKEPLTRREILRSLRSRHEALKSFGVKRIGLFGSYAAGSPNKKSDVDILVEFQEPTWDNFIGLSEYLEKLFRTKVDILTRDGVESIRVKEVADSIRSSVIYL